MIVITGLRSGTSLMMQTLKLLGFPVTGFLFHDDFIHKELNPKGYYDLPINEVINGLNTDIYKGKAVKLAGTQLYKTNPKYVSKIINCKRCPSEAIKSVKKLLWYEENMTGVEPTDKNAEVVYRINLLYAKRYIEENNIPHISIYYEEMLLDPKGTILKVKDYLEIETDISNAVLNVDKRSLLCQSHQ